MQKYGCFVMITKFSQRKEMLKNQQFSAAVAIRNRSFTIPHRIFLETTSVPNSNAVNLCRVPSCAMFDKWNIYTPPPHLYVVPP